ncbi:MAG TPA: ABC transporter permease [Gemmatimonadota bacterium]|jgi:putative ABC transport system permease protein
MSRHAAERTTRQPAAPRAGQTIDFGESLGVALGTLRANKLRSVLTVLGIVIGVTSIVAMTSLIRGLDRSVTGSIESFGTTNLFLRKWGGRIVKGDAELERLNRRPDITEADARAIERRIPGVALTDKMYGTGPEAKTANLRYRGETARDLFVTGASETYLLFNDSEMADGRMFLRAEVRSANRVVVLGDAVAKKLFPNVDPIGKRIQIGGFPYTVLGVLVKKDLSLFLMREDNRVIIPYTAYKRDFAREDDTLMVLIQPESPTQFRAVRGAVIALMRLRHGLTYSEENDFDLLDSTTFLELWDQISHAVFLTMIVISSIGLMVGGIGVMNIMLVSVTERTREIGVRKAIGARRRDILLQFLVEAAILTGVGGLIGVFLGTLLALLVSHLVHFPASIPPWSYALGVGFSSLIGIFFGLYPANKAARLDPIAALRWE